MKRALVAAGLAGVTLVTLTGCLGDKASEPFKDAPRTGVVNQDPADVIEMPDGFSNLASKCDTHGNRVYVAYHGDSAYASIFVLKDSTCG